MSPTTNHSYEFGGFALDPNESELVYHNERVALTGRDLDVLIYMVQNPKQLITISDLVTAVWGDKAKIISRNITHHIAKVRKALDCDPLHPTFIETVPKKGYRFIADVKRLESQGTRIVPVGHESEKYLVTSHIFVPMYLGEKVYENISETAKTTRWATYKEFPAVEGMLCVMPNGMAVWHQTRTAKFESISVIARWRRQAYVGILEGRHRIIEIVEKMVKNARPAHGSLFRSKLSTPGYVFSAFVMESPRWNNVTRIQNALRLLACLTPLETKRKQRKEDEIALEQSLLEHGFSERDLCEFGLRGTDAGFVSWNGMSYCRFSDDDPGLISDLIQFQVAVQAVWWFSKSLSDEFALSNSSDKKRFDNSMRELKVMYANVESIGPRDTSSQRTMIEAVLTTSRLESLVQKTIRQYEQM